jgi:NADH-quinone oxidoreductase subunit G
VLWGERLSAGGAGGPRALLAIADSLAMAAAGGAGLLEVPAFANGRGLREAGLLPNAGPGLQAPERSGRDAAAIAAGLQDGELAALYLLHCDPLRDLADPEQWRQALAHAGAVVAHAAFATETIREHATVVFPAEAYPEKNGTVVHPEGRLQRVRAAIARPDAVRAEWAVIAELARRLGLDLGLDTAAAASQALFETVPFYAGLTLEAIGGRGICWQERPAAAALPAPGAEPAEDSATSGTSAVGGAAATRYRSLWDAQEVEFSPALEFLFPDRAALEHDRRQAAVAEELALGAGPA